VVFLERSRGSTISTSHDDALPNRAEKLTYITVSVTVRYGNRITLNMVKSMELDRC
jgi:hypothetical protein